MPFLITIADSEVSFNCVEEQNVLKAMERLGLKGIPVGCRGGGCGICRVEVAAGGQYHTQKMSRAQISAADEAAGICLACKLFPHSDLTVKPLGLLRSQLLNYTDGSTPNA
jgi:ferredoxin